MIFGYWYQVRSDETGVLPAVDEIGLDALCGAVIREVIDHPGDRLKQRQALLERMSEGDMLIAPCLARLAQDMDDLFSVMEQVFARRTAFRTLDMPEETYEGGLGPAMFSAAAGFQRTIRRAEAKREAAIVRQRGRNGGRPKTEKSAINRALRLYDRNQLSIQEITQKTGVSKSTLYKYIAQRRAERKIPSAAEEDPNNGKG